ncbi:hypothetical protein FHG87_024455 [Trinorchestia longiramus]|nr:hypothetical protein FHG87_024455 [Trinorchestia longiramus]
MFGMNVMAWNGGDLEKLKVLQNRVGRVPLGAPKWTAAEALRGDLGWKNKWNARCVEEDSGMRYLVGLDEECNMTFVDAMKDFLVHAWNRQQ